MEKITIEEGKSAILVDIDGTIANIDARLERAREEADVSEEEVADSRNFYRDNRRFKFFDELFNAQAIRQLDVPIDFAVERLNNLSKFFKVFYLSSRPLDEDNSNVFDATVGWLEDHGFPDGVLIMRPKAQKKSSFFIQTISELIEREFKIHFAVDDLYDGVSHYEAFGINVVKVNGKVFDVPTICVVKDGNEVCI